MVVSLPSWSQAVVVSLVALVVVELEALAAVDMVAPAEDDVSPFLW
jgi:hypothetical protein